VQIFKKVVFIINNQRRLEAPTFGICVLLLKS